jgi:hypothetical protein
MAGQSACSSGKRLNPIWVYSDQPVRPIALKVDAFVAFLDAKPMWKLEIPPALSQCRTDQANWVKVHRLPE